jgi:hypothetical protein
VAMKHELKLPTSNADDSTSETSAVVVKHKSKTPTSDSGAEESIAAGAIAAKHGSKLPTSAKHAEGDLPK